MFFVDKPYVSDFFKITVKNNAIPVVGTDTAKEMNLYNGTKIISEDTLNGKHIYQIVLKAPMQVAEFCGVGLPRLNIDNSINTSSIPYTVPQAWSAWAQKHPLGINGIRYHSRHLPSVLCVACFDHFEDSLSYTDLGSVAAWIDPINKTDIWDILSKHGWVVA